MHLNTSPFEASLQYHASSRASFLLDMQNEDATTAYSRAKSETQHLDSRTYTIIVLAYKREHLLRKNLELWTSGTLPSLSHIIVNWPPQDQDIPQDLLHHAWSIPVTFRRVSGEYGNRFERPAELKTQAVLNLDDDVFMPHPEIEFGFEVFRSMQHPFIGWIPRRFYRSKDGKPKYTWDMTNEHSMVLTGVSFMHTALFSAYSIPRFATMRQHIAERKNCEDILMNFVVRNATGMSPLLIDGQHGHIKHCFSGGISSQPTHIALRHDCLAEFFNHFGDDGLVSSGIVLTRQRTTTEFQNVTPQAELCRKV